MKKRSIAILLASLMALTEGPATLAQSGDMDKIGEAAAVAQYRLLFGEEVPILVERAYASMNEALPAISALWGTGRQPGSLAEQWVAATTVFYDDMVLYLRSASDAAADAVKEKVGKGTDADVVKLRARVEATLGYFDHVLRKKGAEVAMFRDIAQGWVDTLRAYKANAPAIVVAMNAEVAFARDTATRVEKALAENPTITRLEDERTAIEVARRGLTAAKNLGIGRRRQIGELLKSIAPEVLLASFRKASEGWIPSDGGAGTFVSQGQRETIGRWPGDLEAGMTSQYAELYKEAMDAVRPLLAGTFHREIGGRLFQSVALEDLDRVLDPHAQEIRKAIERARAADLTDRDLGQEAESAEEALSRAREVARQMDPSVKKTEREVRELANRTMKELELGLYRIVARRFLTAWEAWQEADRRLGRLEADLKNLQANRPVPASPSFPSAAVEHRRKLKGKREEIEKCKKEMSELIAEIEEMSEQVEVLKARVRGD